MFSLVPCSPIIQEMLKSQIEKWHELNYQDVEFPVSVKDYHKIEVESSININVFGYEDKQFYPIFVSFVF